MTDYATLIAAQQSIQKQNHWKTDAWQNASREIERLVCEQNGWTPYQYWASGRKGGMTTAERNGAQPKLMSFLKSQESIA